MSAMTKAMAPWEHELSQVIGLAMSVVAGADRRAVDPASAVTFAYTTSMVGAEFISAAVAFDLMLSDFDAERDAVVAGIEQQLADWHAEIDWAYYEVRYVIGAAA